MAAITVAPFSGRCPRVMLDRSAPSQDADPRRPLWRNHRRKHGRLSNDPVRQSGGFSFGDAGVLII
jgi:hypothetical protein